jgi:hypothetical protein
MTIPKFPRAIPPASSSIIGGMPMMSSQYGTTSRVPPAHGMMAAGYGAGYGGRMGNSQHQQGHMSPQMSYDFAGRVPVSSMGMGGTNYSTLPPLVSVLFYC